jgi:hypothetical protein
MYLPRLVKKLGNSRLKSQFWSTQQRLLDQIKNLQMRTVLQHLRLYERFS